MSSLVDFDRLFSASPGGGIRDDGTSGTSGMFKNHYKTTINEMTSVTAQKNSWEGVWSTYMETFDKHDQRITNAWKEDATGLLVFVSHIL